MVLIGGPMMRQSLPPNAAALARVIRDCSRNAGIITRAGFVCTAAPTKKGSRIKGYRYPIASSGLATQWKRDRNRATRAAPTLAQIARKPLDHSRITPAAKYAHVPDDVVLAAMNGFEKQHTKAPTKAPRKVPHLETTRRLSY